MTTKTKLIFSFICTFLYFIIGGLFGPQSLSDEMRCLFYSGIDEQIMMFGIVFTIMSISNFNNGLIDKALHIFIGVGILIFGVGLSLNGFFGALVGIGIYTFIFSHFISDTNYFRVGLLILVVISWNLAGDSKGWKRKDIPNEITYGNCDKATWTISINPNSSLNMPVEDYRFVGKYADAKVKGEQLLKEFDEKYSKTFLRKNVDTSNPFLSTKYDSPLYSDMSIIMYKIPNDLATKTGNIGQLKWQRGQEK